MGPELPTGATENPQDGADHAAQIGRPVLFKPHQVAADAPTPYRSATPANGCLVSEERKKERKEEMKKKSD
jgi:hypothetical protein